LDTLAHTIDCSNIRYAVLPLNRCTVLHLKFTGPIAGGPFLEGDDTPRAVSKSYFQKICPHPTVIRADKIFKYRGGGTNALEVEETWLDYLRKVDDSCLEVAENSGNIFHVL
jgi:hypothetical protein